MQGREIMESFMVNTPTKIFRLIKSRTWEDVFPFQGIEILHLKIN